MPAGVFSSSGKLMTRRGATKEAAEAYKQAIALKPDVPGYYNNLGNVLARAGKIDEAKAAYTKSAELDPTNAATAWRKLWNQFCTMRIVWVTRWNVPKSADFDPKNAQTGICWALPWCTRCPRKKVGDR